MTPNDRKYTKEHEWLMQDDQGIQIGITDFAQHELGDIVYVELPEIGASFEKGDSFAVVESVKAVSNIYTAVRGEVIMVNEELDGSPELINEAPYENYIAVLSASSFDDAELLSAQEYEAFIAEEK